MQDLSLSVGCLEIIWDSRHYINMMCLAGGHSIYQKMTFSAHSYKEETLEMCGILLNW